MLLLTLSGWITNTNHCVGLQKHALKFASHVQLTPHCQLERPRRYQQTAQFHRGITHNAHTVNFTPWDKVTPKFILIKHLSSIHDEE